MPPRKRTLRKCPQGHSYYKSTDCPTCPKCEAARKPSSGFLAELSAPARRALENLHVLTLAQLARHTRREILALHGVGPRTMPKLAKALRAAGLSFKGE